MIIHKHLLIINPQHNLCTTLLVFEKYIKVKRKIILQLLYSVQNIIYNLKVSGNVLNFVKSLIKTSNIKEMTRFKHSNVT